MVISELNIDKFNSANLCERRPSRWSIVFSRYQQLSQDVGRKGGDEIE